MKAVKNKLGNAVNAVKKKIPKHAQTNEKRFEKDVIAALKQISGAALKQYIHDLSLAYEMELTTVKDAKEKRSPGNREEKLKEEFRSWNNSKKLRLTQSDYPLCALTFLSQRS